jgi:hypothetical protein
MKAIKLSILILAAVCILPLYSQQLVGNVPVSSVACTGGQTYVYQTATKNFVCGSPVDSTAIHPASALTGSGALLKDSAAGTVGLQTGTGVARLASGVATAAELSGDATTSGSNAVTVTALHDAICHGAGGGAVLHSDSPYAIPAGCSYMDCDATAGAVVLTLPATSGSGREITAKKIDSSTSACTPTVTGGDVVDGVSSFSLTSQWASSKVVDRATGYWDRSHVNQLVGDVSGSSIANTVTKLNGTSLAGLATGFLFNTITTGVPSVPTATANTVLAGPASGAAAVPTTRALVAADIPAVPIVSGTGGALAGPSEFYVCTTTCTVTPPVPVAGYQFCVRNAPGVSTVITLAGVALVYYEKTDLSGYGTVATAATSSGITGDKICIVGLDATHYLTYSYMGTWTVN